jgi:hypothetical protein
LFSITRQAIINDDLTAFTDIPRKMGRAAARTVGDLVFSILTSNPTMSDGVALFHASHNNLAGSGAAITAASVGAGRTAMRTQKDGKATLNIRPSFLLVPAALEDTAQVLMTSETDPSKTNSRVPNPVRNAAEVIVDARLEAASTIAWYLAADPSVFDTIEVGYLDGIAAPFLDQQDGWTIDGVEYKVRIDATRTPLENYNKEMTQLNQLLEKGYINQETFGRAVEQANQKMENATKKTGETIGDEFSRIGETMEGTIADSLDAISGRFYGFGDFFKGMLSDINRALLNSALKNLGITGKGGFMDDIFGSIGGLFGGSGGSGGGFGGLLSSVGNFFGGFFADGGKLKPGQFGIVGERGPELAFAGNSPLHIMPNQALGGAAPITVNMNVQTPDVRSFRQSQSQIAADMARSIERARRNL